MWSILVPLKLDKAHDDVLMVIVPNDYWSHLILRSFERWCYVAGIPWEMGLTPFSSNLEVVAPHPKSNSNLDDTTLSIHIWALGYEMIPCGAWPSYVPPDVELLSRWGYALDYYMMCPDEPKMPLG